VTAREEIVKNAVRLFAVVEQKWDDRNYPYDEAVSLWEDHLQAFAAMEALYGSHKNRKIVLRSLDVLSSGRVVWHNVKTVWENDQWVSPEHDPRSKDPQYREYLRLKEIYETD
jgi:hypothetical protein